MDRLEKAIEFTSIFSKDCIDTNCRHCGQRRKCDKIYGKFEANDINEVLNKLNNEIGKEPSITLKNIDLSKTSSKEQLDKYYEELNEFREALIDLHNINAKGNVKQHVIEEYFDVLQTGLGLLQKEGITAEEVMAGYEKHLKKMEEMGNKPRD